MTLKAIIRKCRELSVCEERSMTEEYLELVFFAEDIHQWNEMVTDVLGPAIKCPGKGPTPDHLNLTKKYGGIRVDQTLFRKESNGGTIIAMFWPWQDGIHTTLKIARAASWGQQSEPFTTDRPKTITPPTDTGL